MEEKTVRRGNINKNSISIDRGGRVKLEAVFPIFSRCLPRLAPMFGALCMASYMLSVASTFHSRPACQGLLLSYQYSEQDKKLLSLSRLMYEGFVVGFVRVFGAGVGNFCANSTTSSFLFCLVLV
ncbi:hypothetical protein ElyMa_003168700 [Elysia marginata]|uniref:Uncharacterized protein n=1 Tax=Elysia marginata TaxID=1093978 RepID=A0AAV4J0A3_9GAST|nr:hypothetical protein ElyMa_003168700 [Elysia marginata]